MILQSRLPSTTTTASSTRRCATTTTKEATHQIHQRVHRAGLRDAEVHLGDHVEGLLPGGLDLAEVRGVLGGQLAVEVGAAALDREQQQAQEVEQRDAGEHAGVGRAAADVLRPEHPLVLLVPHERAREDPVARVGRAQVCREEVRQDGPARVQRRRVRVVFLEPLVLELGEDLGRVLGAED